MPRYAYQTPRARVYAYNYGYMNNYYKPLTYYVEKEARTPSEQPGHLSLAERLKTFPMDGSIYRHRAASVPPRALPALEEKKEDLAVALTSDSLPITRDPLPPRKSPYALTLKEEVSKTPHGHRPLAMKHPFRLPVEDLHVAPHESSIWPESVPHFNLVSSYDLMCGYLGLSEPRTIKT